MRIHLIRKLAALEREELRTPDTLHSTTINRVQAANAMVVGTIVELQPSHAAYS
jgi:hypothetical protein